MPTSTSRVSVIVPTYNRSAYIAESLNSVLGQTHSPTQVIVVDDGSNDGTESVLDAYRGRIHYIRKENGGKPAAINTALPLVTGEFLWIFDDDDVACADALERQVAILATSAAVTGEDATFNVRYPTHFLVTMRNAGQL